MAISRSGGVLTFGFDGDMEITEFTDSFDDMRNYIEFLYNNDVIDIDENESFIIDLYDTQKFWNNKDGELIMCLKGIAYETRCYAYFGMVGRKPRTYFGHRKIVLLEVCDESTDRPYYEREE